MSLPLLLDGAAVTGLVRPADAAAALRAALLGPLDVAAGPPRSAVALPTGQLLLMPAGFADRAGVKLVTVAAQSGPGVPRVAGVYVLFDGASLQPLAVLDGAALTALRTAAVSAVAVERLAASGPARLVVFGTGPQGEAHVQALREVRPLHDVVVVGRDRGRREAFVERVRDSGLPARSGTADDVTDAGVIVCATTARTPLFDGRRVPADSCVVAVGSHEPQARELDAALLRRAGVVVVEDVATAMREAGDVVLAVGEQAVTQAELVPLADLVRGSARVGGPGPSVFKSVGMAWQDLVVAGLVVERARSEGVADGLRA